MMTDEQKSKVLELRAAVAATARSVHGAPPDVRAAVLRLKKDVGRSGTTARKLAAALGIHESTLCRWKHEGVSGRGARSAASKGEGPAGFRVVQVAGSDAGPTQVHSTAMAMPAHRGLRVAHTRSGLVVDGLDVETLAALLQRLS